MLKIALYVIGAIVTEFGLLIEALIPTNSNTLAACIVFPLGIIALVGSIYLFFGKKYYMHCLPRLQYFWWTLGTTLAFFTAFGILFSVTDPNINQVANTVAINILLLYGISLVWVAHLKPSLAQQINESTYRILQSMPGKQIFVSHLFARLQHEYKHVYHTINQYIECLDYIEFLPVSHAGVSEIICRIKSQQHFVAALPVTPTANARYPHAAPAPAPAPLRPSIQPLTRQVSAPALAHIPSPQSPRPNESVRPLADQATIPAIPSVIPQPAIPSVILQQAPPLPPAPNVAPPNAQPGVLMTPPPEQPAAPAPSFSHPPKLPSSSGQKSQSLKIFCCYAHADEHLMEKLKLHLKPQQRQGLVQIWHDRDISAGTEWEQEIQEQLHTAQIILLLVSPEFIASDYCYTAEMQRALERHRRAEVRAIPIILRPVDWQITPLGKLQALPKNGKPITTWQNRDAAYLDVAKGIRAIVETFLTPSRAPQQPNKPLQAAPHPQKVEAEVELIRARCKQGKLIITNKRITIELQGFDQILKSQTLLRSSLSSVDSKLAVAPVFGMGGGMNLIFHGRGRERLSADLVPLKEAKEALSLLTQQ